MSTVFVFQADEMLRRGRNAFRESTKTPCSPANSVEKSPGSHGHRRRPHSTAELLFFKKIFGLIFIISFWSYTQFKNVH